MDHPTAKDIVLNAWKTFSTRDAGQIASLFTADAEWIAPARNATAVALAHTNHMIGPDQIARFIASEVTACSPGSISRFAPSMPMAKR